MERVQNLDEELSMIQEEDRDVVHYQYTDTNDAAAGDNAQLSSNEEDFVRLKTTKFARFEDAFLAPEHQPSLSRGFSALESVNQVTVERKLDFSSIDAAYRPAKGLDQLSIVQEDQSMRSAASKTTKKQERRTPTPRQFLDRLNEKIRLRLAQQEFDQEARRFPHVAQEKPECRKVYDFNCQCRVCSVHLNKLKSKEICKTIRLTKKDELQFSNFVEHSLDPTGKIKKPQVVQVKSELEDGKINYLRDLQKTKSDLMKPNPDFIFTKRGHNWLMENLLPPSDSILGCQVSVPDQVLIEKGKALFIIKTERDGCVNQVNRNKTHLLDVLRHFLTFGLDRKRLINAEQQEQKQNEISQSYQDATSKNGSTPYNRNVQSQNDEAAFENSLTDDSPVRKSQKSGSKAEKKKKAPKKEEDNPLVH
jgi:hypothetical protein